MHHCCETLGLTSDTGCHEAGHVAGNHCPHYNLGQRLPLVGSHGFQPAQHHSDAAEVGKAAQGVRGDDLGSFLGCVIA